MGSIIQWNGRLNVRNAMRRDHDEARAKLVRASMGGGRILHYPGQICIVPGRGHETALDDALPGEKSMHALRDPDGSSEQ